MGPRWGPLRGPVIFRMTLQLEESYSSQQ
jgi:hypothetical protein